MKQIPFDLTRALAGDKVVTRDGREVTQLQSFNCGGDCLAGILDNRLRTWSVDGKYQIHIDGCFDLFMAPKTVKRWVNFYNDEGATVFDSKEQAIISGRTCSGLIAIAVPVEFEEGYGCDQ